MTPCRPRKVAKVTTNDGMPSLATSSPMHRPMNAPVAIPARTEGNQLTSCRVITMPVIAAPVPAVKPADRSISPSSRTKTSPMAITMTPADWLIRLAKLKELVKVPGFKAEKTITRTTSPRIAGNEPTSPPRTRAT